MKYTRKLLLLVMLGLAAVLAVSGTFPVLQNMPSLAADGVVPPPIPR